MRAMPMTTVERVVALQQVPLFADVPGRTLAAVALRATEAEVETGGAVIEEGAVEDHLFAVVTGRLRVHHGDRTLTELGPGSTVGELAALVPEPRSASVTALEPSTLLRIDKPVLDELLAVRPDLATGIITALVVTLRERTRA
jgi:CRP-like cAMP-binding protein